MAARTAMCDTCVLLRSQDLPSQLEGHLLEVKKQKEYINAKKNDAQSNQYTWLSSDFAQAIRLPVFNCQPSRLFFMSGLKVDVLGVVDDFLLNQVNVLLVEGQWSGDKGVTIVGSVLFQRLQSARVLLSKAVVLHTDNCVAQFKNRYLVWLFAYLLALPTTLESIVQVYSVVGHTKFSPDRGFGCIRRRMKTANVPTATQLGAVIDASSKSNSTQCGSTVVEYDWKSFLSQFYAGTISHIMQAHELSWQRCMPHSVQSRDEERISRHLCAEMLVTLLP